MLRFALCTQRNSSRVLSKQPNCVRTCNTNNFALPMMTLCNHLTMSNQRCALSSTSTSTTKKNTNARSSIPKYSKNVSLASEINTMNDVNDVPSYSFRKHVMYTLSNTRRIWTPVLLTLGYFTLWPLIPVAQGVIAQLPWLASTSLISSSSSAAHGMMLASSSTNTLTSLFIGVYVTLGVLLQRCIVRGRIIRIHKNLHGCTCVITGGASGIGLYTALELLNMGATVIIVDVPEKSENTLSFLLQNALSPEESTQQQEKTTETNENMENKTKKLTSVANRVSYYAIDMSDQVSVMSVAARLKGQVHNSLDLLVNCAAVWTESPVESKQGIEQHIATNFLGPFHFTEALLPALRRSTFHSISDSDNSQGTEGAWGGRVVYVSCAEHGQIPNNSEDIISLYYNLSVGETIASLTTARAYAASKLGNIYHAQFIASRRFDGVRLNSSAGPSQEEHLQRQSKDKINTNNNNNIILDNTKVCAHKGEMLHEEVKLREVTERQSYRPISVCIVDPGKCDTKLWHYREDISDVTDTDNGQKKSKTSSAEQDVHESVLHNNVFTRALRSLWRKTPWEGAQGVLYACLKDKIEEGGYYVECKAHTSWLSKAAQNSRKRDEVMRWAMTKTILKYYSFIKNQSK